MKVLLDTDILLDVALRRAEFFEDSAAILRWAESEPGQAAVAWHSLSNISYLLRPDARPFLRDLLEFAVIPSTGTASAQHNHWRTKYRTELWCNNYRRKNPKRKSVRGMLNYYYRNTA